MPLHQPPFVLSVIVPLTELGCPNTGYIPFIPLSTYIFQVDYFPCFNYKNPMPTGKPKILFVADEKLLKRLNDYRFSERIESKSEAIRRLLDDALKKYEKKKTKK
jgi:hypothetical protein